jgi:hypothetical protein
VSFKPANDSAKAKEAAETAHRQWRSWMGEHEAEKFHRNILLFGAGLGQIVWLTDRIPWEPRVNVWNNGFLFWFWDGENRNFGRWHLTTRDGEIEPVPGDGQWVFGRATEKEPQIEGLIRSIGLRFVARQLGLAGWSKFNQKYALAILKVFTPQRADPKDVRRIEQQLNGGGVVLTLPRGDAGNGFDATWEGVGGSTGGSRSTRAWTRSRRILRSISSDRI